ncbi:MAG: ribulose-phosphate 3-epimerase [Lachnospiraceae bacterium]|nr:ribulose-phosphate 3-epimerase [Lachnospiraceae bacterium]MBQ2105629.1 ribulose-phosphate 3-epimerase [Lachnospiraceae bacterium]MBQ2401634.1 ribulose-phosphate 3-epimerase [Lachnospiraceae bacterium]MBQ5598868.1 ribulose-phosphate 3-epimerase [Lachnospiraceae bacterium]MBQ5660136.1 ribulose-phosphate 3-epimerase [Lachnospiraceae bacterium]
MYILAPSVLAADFSKLGEEVKTVADAGAKYIHLDVMDGAFVPSISFGMPVIEKLRGCTDAIFDVHMMVEEPGRYIQDMKKVGADLICVHQEACVHLDRTINQIKEAGCKAAVALNPATPVETLSCILDQVDMFLIMSVNPGFGGQKFIPYAVEKIKKLRKMLDDAGLKTDIQVDGGVTTENVRMLIEAGANVFVAGSAVFKNDAAANTKAFLEIFKEYE